MKGVPGAKRKEDIAVDRMKRNFEDDAKPREEQSTTAILVQAIRVSSDTNATAEETIGALGKQRETIQSSMRHVDETRDNLLFSKRTLRSIRLNLCKEKIIKILIIIFLLFIIWLIIYLKWIRRR